MYKGSFGGVCEQLGKRNVTPSTGLVCDSSMKAFAAGLATHAAHAAIIIDAPVGEQHRNPNEGGWGGSLQLSSSGIVIHREACRSDCKRCVPGRMESERMEIGRRSGEARGSGEEGKKSPMEGQAESGHPAYGQKRE